jgi:glycerol-3-phosphate acyltransferase PlsY
VHISNYILVAAAAYLLGSIPFGYILVRLFTGSDVRGVGSGNIGATNVARTGRTGLAVATLLLDALKGTLAVYGAIAYAWWWSLDHPVPGATVTRTGITLWAGLVDSHSVVMIYQAGALAALCAVAGHMFPVWLRFKGGKGVATGLGVFVALAPRAVLIVFVVFVAVVAITRYVSLGSIVAAALFPFAFWLTAARAFSSLTFFLSCVIALLIVVKHKDNIGRLVTGAENKLGAKKA